MFQILDISKTKNSKNLITGIVIKNLNKIAKIKYSKTFVK